MGTKNPTNVPEDLADAVRRISKAGDDLRNSGLNEEAILLLVSKASRVRRDLVKQVLDALPNLPERFLVQPDEGGES